ncbi:hypothetical protein [Sulfitobacter sp. 1A15106]|uniref:hypothetical protein n=1 Tax=Sulfitobacter sp. 1A15106 TaxID=3368590 RepID=UPI0037470BC4
MATFTSTFGAKYNYFESDGGFYRHVVGTDDLEKLDPATDTWASVTSIDVDPYEYFSAGGVFYRHNVDTPDLEQFDPATDTWSNATAVASTSGQYEYFVEDGTAYRLDTTNGELKMLSGSSWVSPSPAGSTSIANAIITDWVPAFNPTGAVDHYQSASDGDSVVVAMLNSSTSGPAGPLAVSQDGKSWAEIPKEMIDASSRGFAGIVHDGARYIAVSKDTGSGGDIIWSSDLISWTPAPAGALSVNDDVVSRVGLAVDSAGGVLFMSRWTTTTVYYSYSPDGFATAPTDSGTAPGGDGWQVCYSPTYGRFYRPREDNPPQYFVPGSGWTDCAGVSAGSKPTDVIEFDGAIYAFGKDGYHYSSDGINFSYMPTQFSEDARAFVADGALYVQGNGGDHVYSAASKGLLYQLGEAEEFIVAKHRGVFVAVSYSSGDLSYLS